jgi:hypothetical protein
MKSQQQSDNSNVTFPGPNTAGYENNLPYEAQPHPCPSCGRCPTCGRGGWYQQPYYWPQWYYAGYTSGLGTTGGLGGAIVTSGLAQTNTGLNGAAFGQLTTTSSATSF